MIDEAEFKRLKKKAEDARTARERAAGKLEAAMTRLKEEFGCETIAEAKTKAKQLDKEASQAEKDYETAKAEFEEEWEDELG